MRQRHFELGFPSTLPHVGFIDGERRYDLYPGRGASDDPLTAIVNPLFEVLRGQEPPIAILLNEPGAHRIHFTPEDKFVVCRIEFTRDNFGRIGFKDVFEARYDLRQLARDVAKATLDCAGAKMPVSEMSIKRAKQILALLRGESPHTFL